jgi:hypothetical protein
MGLVVVDVCLQPNCTVVCLDQLSAESTALQCLNPYGVCQFSSACHATCSGWNVTNSCLAFASKVADGNAKGCLASGPAAPVSNNSVVDTVLSARPAFGVQALQTLSPVGARTG